MNWPYETEFAEVQAQIGRADTKASILTGLSLAALTGGAAIASKTHLYGFALAAAVLGVGLIGAALVLLGLAVRPNLGGNFGFVRWAAPPDAETLHQQLQDRPCVDDEQKQSAQHLWLLARSARRKYERIRRAVDLLGAALVCAAVTALFTGLGW